MNNRQDTIEILCDVCGNLSEEYLANGARIIGKFNDHIECQTCEDKRLKRKEQEEPKKDISILITIKKVKHQHIKPMTSEITDLIGNIIEEDYEFQSYEYNIQKIISGDKK